MQEAKRPQDITSAEKEKRINVVEELMMQGASRKEILQYCAKEFKTQDRAVDYYIAEAKAHIKSNFDTMFDKEYFKANIFKRLESLYQQNLDIEDFKECRAILKELRDMFGLNEASKLDVTTNGEILITERPKVKFVKKTSE